MASDLRIRVGGATAMLTIGANITDAQVAKVLERYALSLRINTEGTAQERLMRVLEHWVDDVRRRAKEHQAAEVRAEQEAALRATVDADNNL